jgi:DNA repair protein RadA/Sms
MSEAGLEEVADPSELLVGERRTGISGSVVFPALHGSRPVLIEIQALVVDSRLGRRVAIGIEPRRLSLVLGVLSKRMGMDFMEKDVFVAAAGGAAATEPAADLAIALALSSAVDNVPFPAGGIAVGELGLAGEVRSAPGLVRRLGEAGRLGFDTAFVPPRAPVTRAPRAVAVDDVVVAIERALRGAS